jgi:hypothetical protein
MSANVTLESKEINVVLLNNQLEWITRSLSL